MYYLEEDIHKYHLYIVYTINIIRLNETIINIYLFIIIKLFIHFLYCLQKYLFNPSSLNI